MLSITRRDGEVVRIPADSLVAGKVVPAAPARRRGPSASARELDRIAARGWPAVETEPLGEWTLRASAVPPSAGQPRTVGFTRRANSALALGGPGLALDAALERVSDWYAARSLPAYVQLSTGAEGTQEQLAAELAARGWTREVSAQVRIAALAPVADLDADIARVVLSRDVDEAWLGRYQRSVRPAPAVLQVLRGGPSVWFASVPAPDGGVRAIGRLVVDGRWAGFSAVETGPDERRRGLATAVMTALSRRALEEGASAAYLQVEADNDAAAGLYDRLGFVTHHAYHHWRAGQGGPR